jgi:hypothetical protein
MPLELVGGAFDGEPAEDGADFLYVAGSVRRIPGSSPGTPGIVRVSRLSDRPLVGVSDQSVYAKRLHPRPHYRHMTDLADDE